MQLRIGNGKGQKTRIVPMAPRLLTELREYWKVYRPSLYLFPGKTPDVPLQPTTIQKKCKVAAKEAGILKNVTPHTLRHSYATGLLEAGVDLLAISRLLGLRRLHANGKLNVSGDWEFLQDKATFDDWLKPLESKTWVAYIEPPPYENCPPEQMAKYLARYLTGGPISDRRIVSHENGFVTFLARVGKTIGGSDEVEPIKLRGAEFVRRWSLHILPKGYTKTHRFGGYWNGRRKDYLAECRALLASAGLASEPSETPASSLAAAPDSDTTPCCPQCKLKMRWIGFEEKQSWRILMYSPHRPQWYRDD